MSCEPQIKVEHDVDGGNEARVTDGKCSNLVHANSEWAMDAASEPEEEATYSTAASMIDIKQEVGPVISSSCWDELKCDTGDVNESEPICDTKEFGVFDPLAGKPLELVKPSMSAEESSVNFILSNDDVVPQETAAFGSEYILGDLEESEHGEEDTPKESAFSPERTTKKRIYKKRLPKIIPCTVCGKVLKNTNSYNNHMRRFHPDNKDNDDATGFTCQQCSQRFFKKSNLRRHRETVHGGKGQQNEFSPNIVLHTNDSTNESEGFPCSQCGKRLKSKRSLRNHYIGFHANDGERPFQCQQCSKGFITQSNLKVHEQVIHNRKLHKCRFCPKTFFYTYHCTDHEKLHVAGTSAIMVFPCAFCNKTYESTTALKYHVKECHKNETWNNAANDIPTKCTALFVNRIAEGDEVPSLKDKPEDKITVISS